MRDDRKAWKQLRELGGEYTGFQIKKARRPSKAAPEWAGSQRAIEAHILAPVRRRVRIAYLFWCVGLTAREVAAEIGESEQAVESTLHRLRRSEPHAPSH